MEGENNTQISHFLLLGFSEDLELQSFLFLLFLSMYLVTVFGNLLIILASITDSHLHMPMYFFLSNLSFCDIFFTSTTVPKMLFNIQMHSKIITYEGCLAQMYFSVLFAGLGDILLTVMAYDRFVAICHPLHYTVIMNPCICTLLVLGSWFISALHSLLQSSAALQLSYCMHLEIPHFFCELNLMVQLACSDTFVNNILLYFASGLLGVAPLAGILVSYSKIVSSIRAISTAQGKYKAFSTCASHLSVVALFYCTSLGVYLTSAALHNTDSNATASVLYTLVTPMLNPFIYSLRNKEIKAALKTFFGNRAPPQPQMKGAAFGNPPKNMQTVIMVKTETFTQLQIWHSPPVSRIGHTNPGTPEFRIGTT
ncbi:olfactory receptor 7A17-like [Tamandua tetradactyla]|uniref:olfactory receptor 7A17-like n=1 Tax=Tamandua tetradactyla TaxID=48850 RepID=UPI0040541797